MSLFARSTIFRVLPAYLMSIFIFIFILSLGSVQRLITLVTERGLHLTDVILLLVYRLPEFFSSTLPLSVITASLLTMLSLSTDSEFVAMRAAGMSLWKIAAPFIGVAIFWTLFSAMVTLWLQPLGFKAFEETKFRLLRSYASKSLKPGQLNYDFSDKVIYVNEKEDESNLQGIFIADQRQVKNAMSVFAKKGELAVSEESTPSGQIVLRMSQGELHLKQGNPENYWRIKFETFNYIFDALSFSEVSVPKPHIWSVPTASLLGLNTAKALNELMLRITTPLACLSLALAATPLGVVSSRSGRVGSYLRGLILLVGYYILWIGAKELAFYVELHSSVLLMPPMMIASLGLFLIHRMNQ